MRNIFIPFMTGALVIGAQLFGCGSDDRPAPTGGAGGAGSTSTASDASSASSGTGGYTGEDPLPPCTKQADLVGPITSDRTLGADTCWLMKGIVFVQSGATLTIEKGTKIMGEHVSLATLVVQPGGKIVAEGTATNPIVFTSQGEPGDRAPGDWGGVIVLGKAPINVDGGVANVEGITGEGTEYGGSDPNDDSGVISYVRIEFSGVLLSPDNEVNGLTLAGVGAKTQIDHVMVHETLDDCFEFFGGTVNAKYLVCANNQDDGFDFDLGYVGNLQFLALIQDPDYADDTNGFESDNDGDSSLNTPLTAPTVFNATLCGKNNDVSKQQYGMLLRRSTRGYYGNIIATGFEAGVDIRDPLTEVVLEGSIFYDNLAANVAYVEDDDSNELTADDDGGLDEAAWFQDGGNMETDPHIHCFGGDYPDFTPDETLTSGAVTPPDDGFFDATATYIGAFKAGENWASGRWIDFSRN